MLPTRPPVVCLLTEAHCTAPHPAISGKRAQRLFHPRPQPMRSCPIPPMRHTGHKIAGTTSELQRIAPHEELTDHSLSPYNEAAFDKKLVEKKSVRQMKQKQGPRQEEERGPPNDPPPYFAFPFRLPIKQSIAPIGERKQLIACACARIRAFVPPLRPLCAMATFSLSPPASPCSRTVVTTSRSSEDATAIQQGLFSSCTLHTASGTSKYPCRLSICRLPAVTP